MIRTCINKQLLPRYIIPPTDIRASECGGQKGRYNQEAHYIYLCILYILFGQICFLSLPEAELEKNNQTFWCATSVLFFGNWKTPNIRSWNSWRENVLRRGNLLKVLAITHNYMITWRNTKEEDERFILQVTQFFFSISLIEINQNKQFLLVSCGCKSEINPIVLPPHPQVGKCNIDLNDGKNFTTMEWLMVFVKVPL